jgi:hypothetical protein
MGEEEEFLSWSRVVRGGGITPMKVVDIPAMPPSAALPLLVAAAAPGWEEHLQASIPVEIPDGTARMGSHRQHLSHHRHLGWGSHGKGGGYGD